METVNCKVANIWLARKLPHWNVEYFMTLLTKIHKGFDLQIVRFHVASDWLIQTRLFHFSNWSPSHYLLRLTRVASLTLKTDRPYVLKYWKHGASVRLLYDIVAGHILSCWRENVKRLIQILQSGLCTPHVPDLENWAQCFLLSLWILMIVLLALDAINLFHGLHFFREYGSRCVSPVAHWFQAIEIWQ